ncbi:MAG: hypothetical protein KAH97_06595 [Anaerolineales bacterium]|jgi:hypothetical protein|nr:hypothetical protein [Anaerolineales bacterium]
MPRVRCRYLDCIFLDDGFCGTSAVEIDPDEGCLTYTQVDEINIDKDWEEEDLEKIWEVEDVEALADDDDDDDDLWLEANL